MLQVNQLLVALYLDPVLVDDRHRSPYRAHRVLLHADSKQGRSMIKTRDKPFDSQQDKFCGNVDSLL